MRKIRVGVVGVGRMGQYHVGVYSQIFQTELVGVADVNESRAREIAERYNTVAYTDYRELRDQVEVVSVAVPTRLHYPVARDFLQAGVHVLLEKPMAPSLEEARELFEIAQQNGLALHIGHVERFNGAVQELKKIVEQPIFIESRRLGPFEPRIQDEGVVLDLMIHDLDIILHLVNSRVVQLNALGCSVMSGHEDLASLQLLFENGCIANITASRVTQHKIRTLAVTQRDAYVFLNYTDQDIHIHRHASSEHILTKMELRYKQESVVERIFVHKDNPLKLELLHLLDCATNGAEREVPVDGDLYSLEIALQILEKLKEKKVHLGTCLIP
ncbi:MAG: Gfo/Idh/MocA family oxidoreductase [Candidatus Tectomicrobia bacterium]|uniref:Gfo/Idh/MocA family oxidoreductase n=1 Tax=Tectimicrobiota bacterium TaxID=2528274 RepID=A0A932CNM4_UNCTE|nr:Gfo/Idh/MocA family oxidoreductase [Candidatus Tectomicrobia bacterium]